MSHFAKIQQTEQSNIFEVVNVIVAEQDVIDSGLFGDPSSWVQTSYNTYGNVHYAPSPPNPPKTPDGGVALRGNYAKIGDTYDKVNDVFYSQKPVDINGLVCNSWTLSNSTWLWTPPTPAPKDNGLSGWDESKQQWVITSV